VRRYRSALAEAFEKLGAFGYDADAKEIADRYGFVYLEPKPEVRLSSRWIGVGYFEMSSEVAYVEGECGRCLRVAA
jgi:hypothetical protein